MTTLLNYSSVGKWRRFGD